jgi:hypothetical protein
MVACACAGGLLTFLWGQCGVDRAEALARYLIHPYEERNLYLTFIIFMLIILLRFAHRARRRPASKNRAFFFLGYDTPLNSQAVLLHGCWLHLLTNINEYKRRQGGAMPALAAEGTCSIVHLSATCTPIIQTLS